MWTFARGSENILITSESTGLKLQPVVSLREITTIILILIGYISQLQFIVIENVSLCFELPQKFKAIKVTSVQNPLITHTHNMKRSHA